MKPSFLINLVEYVLAAAMATFMGLGILHKRVTKTSVLIGLAAYLLIKIIRESRQNWSRLFEWTPVHLPFLLFMLFSLVSTIVGGDPYHAHQVWLYRYLQYFIIFTLGVYIGKDRRYFWMVLAAFLSGVFFISLGGIEQALMLAGTNHFSRLFSSFGSVSLFGAGFYFLYALPLFIACVLYHPRRNIKLLSAVAGLPVMVCFFLNYSRSIWISLPVGLLIASAVCIRKKRVIAGLIAVYFFLIMAVPYLRDRLFSAQTFDPETWGRLNIWSASWRMFLAHPVFGAGPGGCEFSMLKFVPAGTDVFKDVSIHMHAHNIYLEVLAENGFIGFVSFILIFAAYFRVIMRSCSQRFDYMQMAFLVIVSSVLISELAGSTIMVGVYIASAFWFLLGLSLGRAKQQIN